ncbi:tRNA (adenosine(37)-N6)-dimethylallyltransferase MiaA [Jeotgalibacillus haloalkalitolerans]|uniref:tRNA dimethylallyltransferase n=1 Tax=Jeotgalibacillus haloalkalitolerans TaxID=3104292 RepID=A0ABU5KM72_9BACL|nr:tRNA (adenosine(37)-N6)-dimethylallyltransferase MiaA [Jeotgalibacillus sp. HH7-29]MDZ5711810.1 tRNA (adenosine(37)-N6)-dimethylallyltransferase MiaA [Jeotgalibacillus sp. HH7-29]
MNKQVIVIAGPTAVGKTELSIQLSKAINGEVINGDAMQVYKGLDIGTAKIRPEEMQGVPHHLFDIKEPDQSFSAAEYQRTVRNKISEVHKRGAVPVLTGGTGLYIQSVLYDYNFSDKGKNEEVRAKLEEAHLQGVDLHTQLRGLDPVSASEIHPNNIRRVIRALEIIETTGMTPAELKATQKPEAVYDHECIGLDMDRDLLYDRINMRVDKMIEEGLVEEVRKLYQDGIRDVTSVQAIGYKELYAYFDGKVTYEEAIDRIKQNSRRYAKRQLTWFRNKMSFKWFNMTENREKKIKEIIEYFAGI